MGLFGKKDDTAKDAATQAQNQSAHKHQYQTNQDTDTKATSGESASWESGASTSFSFTSDEKLAFEEIVRGTRGQAYLDIVSSIDLTSATDEEIIERLRGTVEDEILEEYKEMTPEEIIEELRLCFQEELERKLVKLEQFPQKINLLEVISKCFISGCDIHAIDKKGNILKHYEAKSKLSRELTCARILYHQRQCQCVEVYSNCCVCVNSDGTTEVVYHDDVIGEE